MANNPPGESPRPNNPGPARPAPVLAGQRPAGARPAPVIAPAPTVAAVAVSLKSATRGIITGEPIRALAHGPEGVGKTTFGANAPRCLVLGAEDGSAEIPVFGRIAPSTWEEAEGVIDALTADEHDYQSLAIDSLDWLEPLCWDYVCRKFNKKTIESFGFGKGFNEALGAWRIFVARVKTLQNKRRLNVIAIAHSQIKTFKNPEADQGDYDRYQLKLHNAAAGLWKEWAKAVLFLNYDRATVEVNENRHKGVDTGKRIIKTRMTAAYDAKNRYWLPAELPLSWAAFYREVKATEGLRARFGAAVMALPEERRERVQEDLEAHDYEPFYVEQIIAGLSGSANGNQ